MDGLIDSDVDVRGFSVRTGYYLACASKAAYEEHSDWIEKLGPGNRITVFSCGQFHGLVGLLEKVALLTFRGTHNIGNCLTDADALLVSQFPYPGRVHSGFAEAVAQVWPEVRRILGNPSRAMPLAQSFDSRHGGFGPAPKFPQPMLLSLLLQRWRQTGRDTLLDMANMTLEHMARGGMYDQLGGGFHRYSVDARWLVPHFETMLYDNALLAGWPNSTAATSIAASRRTHCDLVWALCSRFLYRPGNCCWLCSAAWDNYLRPQLLVGERA